MRCCACSEGHRDAAGDGGGSAHLALAIRNTSTAQVDAILGSYRADVRFRIAAIGAARRLISHGARDALIRFSSHSREAGGLAGNQRAIIVGRTGQASVDGGTRWRQVAFRRPGGLTVGVR